MSWLFGRKKQHKDSPSDSTEEEQVSNQSDDYEFVPNWTSSIQGNRSHDTTSTYPSGNLYPSYIPPVPEFRQVVPTDSSKDFNQGESTHYLNGVPFKLCKYLEINASNDFEIDQLRISEILSFIETIRNQNYDYNFALEESIVAEMNSRNNE